MEEGAVENATAFHFRCSPNNQGVISGIEDVLLHLVAESGGGADLADHLTPQYFSSLFTDGDIKGDTVLHDAARCESCDDS